MPPGPAGTSFVSGASFAPAGAVARTGSGFLVGSDNVVALLDAAGNVILSGEIPGAISIEGVAQTETGAIVAADIFAGRLFTLGGADRAAGDGRRARPRLGRAGDRPQRAGLHARAAHDLPPRRKPARRRAPDHAARDNTRKSLGLLNPGDVAEITSGGEAGLLSMVDRSSNELVVFSMDAGTV